MTQIAPVIELRGKSTSWYSLAMFLDGGLCLAARGGAFHDTATSH